MVFNTGQMALITKANGVLIRLKAKAPSGMRKVTFTEVSLKMIWLTALVNIHILMDPNIKENLKTTCKKATAKKSGLTEPNMWANIKTE